MLFSPFVLGSMKSKKSEGLRRENDRKNVKAMSANGKRANLCFLITLQARFQSPKPFGSIVLEVLYWHADSCPGSPALESCPDSPGCPFLAVLLWLCCYGCPVLFLS